MALIRNASTMVSDAGSGAAKNAAKPVSGSGIAGAGQKKTQAGAGSSNYNQYLIAQAMKTPAATSGSALGTAGGAAATPAAAAPVGGQTAAATTSAHSYDLTDYIRQQQAAALEANLSGLKAAYNQSLAAYDAAAGALPQSYDAARNAAAAQTALARQGFDERAAAAGLGSGAATQAELARDSVYRGTLADIDRAQAEAQNEISLAKAKLQDQYEAAITQAKASGDSSLASALYQELVRVQGLDQEDSRYAQKLALNYGMLPGTSLASIGSINSLSDLAGLVYKAGKR